jgi:hypothetical protein
MDGSVKLVRILQVALLGGVLLCVIVGEALGSIARVSNTTMFYVLSMVTVTILGVILVVRRTLVTQSANSLAVRPADAATLARWRTGYVMTYALSEAIALFGLILRLTGFSLSQVAPFYVAGFILLIFFGPRRPVSAARA